MPEQGLTWACPSVICVQKEENVTARRICIWAAEYGLKYSITFFLIVVASSLWTHHGINAFQDIAGATVKILQPCHLKSRSRTHECNQDCTGWAEASGDEPVPTIPSAHEPHPFLSCSYFSPSTNATLNKIKPRRRHRRGANPIVQSSPTHTAEKNRLGD